jgi:hypothetical protein
VNAGFVAGDSLTLVVDTGGNTLAAQTVYGYASAARQENQLLAINTEKHFDHIGHDHLDFVASGNRAMARDDHGGVEPPKPCERLEPYAPVRRRACVQVRKILADQAVAGKQDSVFRHPN